MDGNICWMPPMYSVGGSMESISPSEDSDAPVGQEGQTFSWDVAYKKRCHRAGISTSEMIICNAVACRRTGGKSCTCDNQDGVVCNTRE